jgi:hypothetical protein
MYGNVDAALLYFIRFTKYATDANGLGLIQSESDPCVFYRRNEKNETDLIIIVYVDDCMLMGTQAVVNEMKLKLKQEFGVVEDGQLKKLLGVRYDWKRDNEDKPYIVMSMNDKAQEIIRAYEKQRGEHPESTVLLERQEQYLKSMKERSQ